MTENKEPKTTKTNKKKKEVTVSTNFFVYTVIGIIIVSFVLTSGVLPGVRDFVHELTTKVQENEDGTRSIPRLAQSAENHGNPSAYIGKVLGKRIQFGHNDNFNRKYDSIINNKNINGYQKYQYIRMIFNDEIEQIIGMRAAEKTGITVSNSSVFNLIAKREYTDSNGKINYDALQRDLSKINQGRSEEVREEMLYEHYEYDYFSNLPVSNEEVRKKFIQDNRKIKLSYVTIPFEVTDQKILDQYLKTNQIAFQQYKISKMIFSDTAKKEAENALISVINAPETFNEVGNQLKADNKLINILNTDSYYFAEDYDNEIADLLITTKIGDVVNKIVLEPNIGYVVVKLEDVKLGQIEDAEVLNKVKEAYVSENQEAIETASREKAYDIFSSLTKGNSIHSVARNQGLTPETPSNLYTINDRIFSFFQPENEEETTFIIKLFSHKKGEIIEPFKYNDGYLVTFINDFEEADENELVNQFEQIRKKLSSEKSNNLKYDYYTAKKKEFKVIDNFHYVFNIQDFLQ